MNNCPHNNLNFQYHNVAGNSVNKCVDCNMMIIKKPNDDQPYILDKNFQLTPAK